MVLLTAIRVLVIALLLGGSATASKSPTPTNTSNFYMITMARALMLHSEHYFLVQLADSRNGVLVIDTIAEDGSGAKHRSESHFLEEGFATVPYKIPFANYRSNNIWLDFRLLGCGRQQYRVECIKQPDHFIALKGTRIPVIQRSLMLLIDLSKPLYKPGERVLFRLLPLYPSMLHPDRFGLSEAAKRSLRVDKVYLEAPGRVRVAQWLNVNWRDAWYGFTFDLPSDPRLGHWHIVAQADGVTETVSFRVRRYVLPRFTMDITPPPFLRIDAKVVHFKVCAFHANQLPIKARVSAQLCLRDPKPSSPTYLNHCINVTGRLDGSEKCVKFAESTTALKVRDCSFSLGFFRTFLNASVIEDGTGVRLEKQAYGGELTFYPFRLIVESPDHFKTGLPYYGLVRTVNPDNSSVSGVRVTISYQEDNQNLTLVEVFTSDADGRIPFYLPVIYRAAEHVNIHFTWTDFRKIHGCADLRNPEAYHVIKHLFSPSGTFLQVYPLDRMKPQKPCLSKEPYLTLNLQSTVPLHDKTINVVGTARGVLMSAQSFGPRSRAVCRNTDDDALGHYICKGESNGTSLIQCMEGWRGPNCLIPVCSQGCENGVCRSRDRCVCRSLWTGRACERCRRHPDCVHGVCHRGGDCICQPGWIGRYCDQRTGGPILPRAWRRDYRVKIRRPIIPASKPMRLDLFQREIHLPINPNLAPSTHQVVWFHHINRGIGSREFVTANVDVSDLSACLQRSAPTAFTFTKQTVRPGQLVTANIRTTGKRPLCALSIADITLDHFRSRPGTLDEVDEGLRALNAELAASEPSVAENRRKCKRPRHLMTVPPGQVLIQDPRPPDSSQAFQRAGVLVISSDPVVTAPCPRPKYVNHDKADAMENADPWMRYLLLTGRVLPERQKNRFATTNRPLRSVQPTEMSRRDKLRAKTAVQQMKRTLRRYFPESWQFSIMDNPGPNMTLLAPDSITTWRAQMHCVSSNGLGVSAPSQLVVFQPFFLQITLPYSLIRGEVAKIPIQVFSYNKPCTEVELTLKGPKQMQIHGQRSFKACLCNFNQLTVKFAISSTRIGWNTLKAVAVSRPSPRCSYYSSPLPQSSPITDEVQRRILVEADGVPDVLSYGDLLCVHNSSLTRTVSLELPANQVAVVKGSERAYLSWSGDVVSAALPHLTRLVHLPVGCGEQNMMAVVPSICVADYLTSLHSRPNQTEALLARARRFIKIGYQRQLRYRRHDGSFSAFGQTDPHGSTWLTAFVIKSFAAASNHVTVDWRLLSTALRFLRKRTRPDGCFREDGRLLMPGLKGGLAGHKDEVSITAYILGALLDARKTLVTQKHIHNSLDIAIKKGLKCLKRNSAIGQGLKNLSTYAIALRAYALTRRAQLAPTIVRVYLEELEQRREIKEGFHYWPASGRDETKRMFVRPWLKFTAEDVETTSYALLTSLRPGADMVRLQPIIRWLLSQRNDLGGWYSTQDSIVALTALTTYSRLTEGLVARADLAKDLRLIVHPDESDPDDDQEFAINNANRLVVTKVPLQLPTRLHLSLRGTGCVALQQHILFNVVQVGRQGSPFRLKTKIFQKRTKCNRVQLTVCARFVDSNRNTSNMAILRVGMASGWGLADGEFEALRNQMRDGGLRRIEMDRKGALLLYYDYLSVENQCINLKLQRRIEVLALQPILVQVFDYYQPEIVEEAKVEILSKKCLPRRRRGVSKGCPSCGPKPNDRNDTWKTWLKRRLCTGKNATEPAVWMAVTRRHNGDWIFARYIGDTPVYWGGAMTVPNGCTCDMTSTALLVRHKRARRLDLSEHIVLDRRWTAIALRDVSLLPTCLRRAANVNISGIVAIARYLQREEAIAQAAANQRSIQILQRPHLACPVCARDISEPMAARLKLEANNGSVVSMLVWERRDAKSRPFWTLSTGKKQQQVDYWRCPSLACSYEIQPDDSRLYLLVLRDRNKVKSGKKIRPDGDFYMGSPRTMFRLKLWRPPAKDTCAHCLETITKGWMAPTWLSYLLREQKALVLKVTASRTENGIINWTIKDSQDKFVARRCVQPAFGCPQLPCETKRRLTVIVTLARGAFTALLHSNTCLTLDGRFIIGGTRRVVA